MSAEEHLPSCKCLFDMWQQEDIAPQNHHVGMFYILLRVNFIVEYTPRHYSMNVRSKKCHGFLERSDLIDDFKVDETMSRMMKSMPVSDKDKGKITKVVGSKAKLMDNNPLNVGRDVISVIMSLRVVYEQEFNRDLEFAWTSRLGKPLGECMPAMESAVIDLDKVVYDKNFNWWGGKCSICLRGFCDGEKITSMPCSHGFHGGCISKWLKKSHLCPLCRFPLQVCGDAEALCPFKEKVNKDHRVYRKPRRRVRQPWLRSHPYGGRNIVDPLG